MNNGTLRVLSIDFDYFQNVDEYTYTNYYPDGKERGTRFSELVWGNKYMYKETNDLLMKVTLNKEEFGLLRVLIAKQSKNTIAIATDSHMFICEAVDAVYKSKGYTGLKIDHIDMHPDVRTDNLTELDCGNWVNFIKDKYNGVEINWVTNPISDTFECVPDAFHSVKSSIEELPYTDYDLIFLCRSDCFLVPHLDIAFDKLFRILKKKFERFTFANDISAPRTVSYKPITSYKEMMKTIKSITEAE